MDRLRQCTGEMLGYGTRLSAFLMIKSTSFCGSDRPRGLKSGSAGDRIVVLLRPDAEWSFVKQHLNGIKLYVDPINDAKPGQLQQCCRPRQCARPEFR